MLVECGTRSQGIIVALQMRSLGSRNIDLEIAIENMSELDIGYSECLPPRPPTAATSPDIQRLERQLAEQLEKLLMNFTCREHDLLPPQVDGNFRSHRRQMASNCTCFTGH